MMKRIDGRNADTLREIKIIRSPQKDPQGSVLVEWGSGPKTGNFRVSVSRLPLIV